MALLGRIEEFSPAFPERWEAWSRRLEFFLAANKIIDNEQKRAVLFSLCGADTFDLAVSLFAPEKVEEASFTEILKGLQQHFGPQQPILARRFEFYHRNQGPTESAAEYLAALRTAARDCKFPELENTLRDRLVCGTREDKVRRRLLAEKEVTLQMVMDRLQAAEAAAKFKQEGDYSSTIMPKTTAVQFADGGEEESEAEEVHHLRRTTNKRPSMQQGHYNQQGAPACASCGNRHDRNTCRFRDAKCHACGKKGHIVKVCRSGPVRLPRMTASSQFERNQNSNSIAGECLTVSTTRVQRIELGMQPKITVVVEIERVPCRMEVDSGSAFSIISTETLKTICPSGGPRLEPCAVLLKDFQGNRVATRGIGEFLVHYKDFQGQLRLIVAEGRRTSLLGLDWFEALGIQVTGIQNIRQSNYEMVCQEFATVFDTTLGCYQGPPVSLCLDPMVGPIRMKARRVPFALKPKIDEELDRLIQQGILEPVDSAKWETPIVTPLKPNGEVRICADYKCTINRALQHHAYPIPVVSHILASLAGGKVFAKLDLAQAYQQLPVDEATAEAQTIVTHRGAFKVKRLQFGVSVAPGIFQSLMDGILRGIPGVIPYFDDVLIAGGSDTEVVSRLREVLHRFAKAGLRVRRDKCQFGVSRVEFLGFIVDADGIHPAPSKVRAIREAPIPKSKQELQAFLGLLNFYHVFLPHKATVAEPLHRLLDKKSKWTWGRPQAMAFEKIKDLLLSNDVLTHFDESLPVVLTGDASPYGIGAVLSHQLPDGREAPIAYYSRTLSSTERNYAQIDREALALVAGVKKFHDYIYGRHFTLVTDHKPLLGLFTQDRQTPQMLSPRMLRWSIFLSAYNYELRYRPGKTLSHADALSRLPIPMLEPDPAPAYGVLLLETLPEPPLHSTTIATHSTRDKVLSRVLNWVWKGWPVQRPGAEFAPFFSRQHELSAHKGCLLWGNRVVIPTELRTQVLEVLHEGHPGIVAMKALARSYVWWPGMDAAIEKWVHHCHQCQESRPAMPQAPVHPWESARAPWSRLHIDFAGPWQGQTFLIVVDSYSKWLEVVPVSTMTTQVVVRALRKLFATYGLPDTIVSDNGAQFTSGEFQEFLASYMIRHVRSAPFHPSTNGQAERMVRTTKEGLSRITQGDWHHRLADFLLRQHITPNAATGRSPAELLMGRRLTSKLDRLHPDLAPEVTSRQEQPEYPRLFLERDPVYVRNYGGGPAWVPAVVARTTGPLSYEVTLPDGRIYRRHVDQMRRRSVEQCSRPSTTESREPCIGRPEDVVESPVEQPVEIQDTLDKGSAPQIEGNEGIIPAERSATRTQDFPISSSADLEARPLQELRRSQRERRAPCYLKDYVT